MYICSRGNTLTDYTFVANITPPTQISDTGQPAATRIFINHPNILPSLNNVYKLEEKRRNIFYTAVSSNEGEKICAV